MRRILILCTGNSCRSQMAEGILRSFDPELEIYSAGTRPEKEIREFYEDLKMWKFENELKR